MIINIIIIEIIIRLNYWKAAIPVQNWSKITFKNKLKTKIKWLLILLLLKLSLD